ncbi:hypothetical protein [Streptococcus hyointestinalis]
MYQAFEIVALFGISRISFLRLNRIKEQRDKYLNGEYWVPTVTGNPKEDRELGYKRDIFMSKVTIVLSSLIGVYALIKFVSQLF